MVKFNMVSPRIRGARQGADAPSAVICIEPETDDGQPYKPWRMRDSPLAIATFEEEALQSGKMSGHVAETMVSSRTSWGFFANP